MTFEELTIMLDTLVEERQLTDWALYEFADAPTLPYAVYLEMSTDAFKADNRTYAYSNGWRLEVYTAYKDLELERRIQDLLSDHVWDKEGSTNRPEDDALITIYSIGGA